MDIKRENHYDLLRIVCCFAVVVIHVSGSYKIFPHQFEQCPLLILLYNTLSRFSVPCFVMLAGAFALSKPQNEEYKFYYKKMVPSFLMPVLVFSCIYFFFSEYRMLVRILHHNGGFDQFLTPVKQFLIGAPFYHMWYLYMMIPIYFAVPIILMWKRSITTKQFAFFSILLAVLSITGGWFSSHSINWDIGLAIAHIGYFLLGYLIREKYKERKDLPLGITLIILGFLTEGLLVLIEYTHAYPDFVGERTLLGALNPILAIGSIFIFAGFSLIRINWNLNWLSKRTFLIYLIHAGILYDVMKKMTLLLQLEIPYMIPLIIIFVFPFSYFLSRLYEDLWDIVDKKFHFSKKMQKLLGLE